MRAVEELLQLAPDLHDIAVVGAEPHPNYNRVLLSTVLPLERQSDGHRPLLGRQLHKETGLFTLDELCRPTKASASCGSCTGLVEPLLMFAARGAYSGAPDRALGAVA
mgnify:CR=1 FL=1